MAFKVGDRVSLQYNNIHNYRGNGATGTVTKVKDDDIFRVDWDKEYVADGRINKSGWSEESASDLRLVEQAKPDPVEVTTKAWIEAVKETERANKARREAAKKVEELDTARVGALAYLEEVRKQCDEAERDMAKRLAEMKEAVVKSLH